MEFGKGQLDNMNASVNSPSNNIDSFLQLIFLNESKVVGKNSPYFIDSDNVHILLSNSCKAKEIPQKTSKNISRYFCSSSQGHL